MPRPLPNKTPDSEPERITPNRTPFTLLVEGVDDKECIWHLLKKFKIDSICRIEASGGYDKLRRVEFRARLKAAEEGDRLGVVVDADTSLSSRWNSLSSVLKEVGYSVPREPSVSGTILIEPDKIPVGLWIMPNNKVPGALEDFIKFLVPEPENNVLWQYAEQVVENIPEKLFPENARLKAQIHTWLAWQKEPGSRIGSAITQKYLSVDVAQATLFIEWIKQVFAVDPAAD